MFGMKKLVSWITVIAVLAGLLTISGGTHAGDTELWQALKSPGHFAMIRHAYAPGNGDPANFKIDDCNTQRNLDERGRAQARKIGALFRQNGIAEPAIYASQWCRCRETATLLGLGIVSDLPSLNSFYEREENKQPQMKALRAFLNKEPMERPLILVTHFVNIGALTGVYPSSGGIVIVRMTEKGSFEPVGKIEVK